VIFRDLETLYAELDERLAGLDFQCRKDGACCRFGESGIRLYISCLEACYLFGKETQSDVAALATDFAAMAVDFSVPAATDCPFQSGDVCSRRRERTLGCRIYVCDSSLDREISALYEEFHGRVRRLHEKYGIEYLYRDIRDWDRFFGG
jgi:Fe-S-cluster containining protein